MTGSDNAKTIRQRKRNSKNSTQRYIPIAEIHNDTVILKNGGLRGILKVEALNFNLKSETEQQGIIAGYQSFVNTLTFPIQITIRSYKLNIDPYISNIRQLSREQSNPLLKQQMLGYATFVEKIVDVADIMQKCFYVIIPVDDSSQKNTSFEQFLSWFGNEDTASRASLRSKKFAGKSKQLRDRILLVQAGLHNIGLRTTKLNTRQLIELFYNIYNPKTSQEQKLPSGNLNTDAMVL